MVVLVAVLGACSHPRQTGSALEEDKDVQDTTWSQEPEELDEGSLGILPGRFSVCTCCLHRFAYLCIYIDIYIYIYVHTHTYIYIYIYVYIYIYTFMYTYIYIYVYMYIYIYVYIYMYMYILIFTYA